MAHAFQTDDARLLPISEKVRAQERLSGDERRLCFDCRDVEMIETFSGDEDESETYV